MKISHSLKALAMATALAAFVGCGSTSTQLTNNDRDQLHNQTADARSMFMNDDPHTTRYFNSAHAYVIFPSIKNLALGVGGAGGDGEVYQGGKLIGTADISQANIGAQIGGQEFAEVIFFQNQSSFESFTNGTWEFDAKASAVAAKSGESTSADYEKGVRVFTVVKGGLMAQAAIGTQKLRFRSMANQNTDTATERP